MEPGNVIVEIAPLQHSGRTEQQRLHQLDIAPFPQNHLIGSPRGKVDVGFAIAVTAHGPEKHGVQCLGPIAAAPLQHVQHVPTLPVETLHHEPVQKRDAFGSGQIAQPYPALIPACPGPQGSHRIPQPLRNGYDQLRNAFTARIVQRCCGGGNDMQHRPLQRRRQQTVPVLPALDGIAAEKDIAPAANTVHFDIRRTVNPVPGILFARLHDSQGAAVVQHERSSAGIRHIRPREPQYIAISSHRT